MPSPVAHSLIGVIFGVACGLPRCAGWRRFGARMWRWRGLLFLCVILANAPDVDYLFGLAAGDLNSRHQLITHTLGWVALVALAVWWAQRYYAPRAVRLTCAFIFLLLASHIVADYFGSDNSPPRGIMALWPLDDRFFISPWPVFPAPEKRALSELWSAHNLRVMAWEFGLLAPVLLAVMLYKTRAPRPGSI